MWLIFFNELTLKHLLCYILFLLVNVAALAEVIDCTPGGLRALVGEKTDMTTLTVKGDMDVSDFDFIAEQMTELTTLVIDARIVAYKGVATRNGSGVSQEGMIPPYALFGTSVKDLTIGDYVTSIGEAAFAGSGIETLVLGNGIRTIPASMAKDATSLRQLSLPESVNEIGEDAFEGCTSLQWVDAQGVTVIGRDAFKGCRSLTAFNFSPELKSIGESAFAATGLTELDLREMTSLKTVGKMSFAECENLAAVALPEGLTTLSEGMFFGDNAITTLLLPTTLVNIETLSLAGLTSLNVTEQVNIMAETAVETVGDYALANWKSTQKIILPETLTYLGDRAMQQWSALETVTIPEGMTAVPELGNEVWANTPQEQVVLEVSSTTLAEAFKSTPQWKEFIITDMSGRENIIDEETALMVTVSGSDIILTCSVAMEKVEVYDIAGQLLHQSAPHLTTASLSASDYPSVLLIRVTTATDKTIIKKIIRK